MLKMEAQERHRYKTRLPRTAEKFSKNQMKSELGDLGVEFNSDQEDEVSVCCSRVTFLVLCGLPSSLSFVVAVTTKPIRQCVMSIRLL